MIDFRFNIVGRATEETRQVTAERRQEMLRGHASPRGHALHRLNSLATYVCRPYERTRRTRKEPGGGKAISRTHVRAHVTFASPPRN